MVDERTLNVFYLGVRRKNLVVLENSYWEDELRLPYSIVYIPIFVSLLALHTPITHPATIKLDLGQLIPDPTLTGLRIYSRW